MTKKKQKFDLNDFKKVEHKVLSYDKSQDISYWFNNSEINNERKFKSIITFVINEYGIPETIAKEMLTIFNDYESDTESYDYANERIKTPHCSGINRYVYETLIKGKYLTVEDIAHDITRKNGRHLSKRQATRLLYGGRNIKQSIPSNEVVKLHMIVDDVNYHYKIVGKRNKQVIFRKSNNNILGKYKWQRVVPDDVYINFIIEHYDPFYSQYEESLLNKYKNASKVSILNTMVRVSNKYKCMRRLFKNLYDIINGNNDNFEDSDNFLSTIKTIESDYKELGGNINKEIVKNGIGAERGLDKYMIMPNQHTVSSLVNKSNTNKISKNTYGSNYSDNSNKSDDPFTRPSNRHIDVSDSGLPF